MEVVKGWTGQQVAYSAKGSDLCIGHGGNEMLPYKRKWEVHGLGNILGYGRKHKRERGQSQGYCDPSRIKGMQRKNERKTRRNGFAKRRMHVPRTVPRAPYNDSSFLIKVRRAGGLAALVSPAPFSTVKASDDSSASCYREDTLEPVTELGVGNGYGSMTGLIHLRATEDGSSCSTVDEIDIDSLQEDSSCSQLDSVRRLEQRLDRDVSRFEMTLPSPSDVQRRAPESLEERVARQDRDIAILEDENLTLKERLLLMQQAVNEYQERLARVSSHGEVEELPAACSNHGSSD